MDNNRTTVTENKYGDESIFDRFNSEKYLNYFDSLYNQTKQYFVSVPVDVYNGTLDYCIEENDMSIFNKSISKDIMKDNTSLIKSHNVIIPFDAVWSVDAKYKYTDMCKKYKSVFSLLTLYSILSKTKAPESNSIEKRKIIHDILFGQYDGIIKIILDDIDDESLVALDDDIENLDTERLVNRFFKALKKEDRDGCLVILGMADRLPIEFINHFKALLYFNDRKYEKAIFYAKKVAKDQQYYDNAVAIILDSYASLGNFDGMIETLKDATDLSIPLSAMNYLTGKAFIRYDGEMVDITDSWIKTRNICVTKESNDKTACDYYTIKCLELVSDAFESVYNFCYNSCIYTIDHKMISYKNGIIKALKLLEAFFEVASELVTNTRDEDLPWEYTHTKDGKEYTDATIYASRYYAKVRNKIKEDLIDGECLNYLQLMNCEWCSFVRSIMSVAELPLKYSFSITLNLLKSFYNLKQMEFFFVLIKDFFEEVIKNDLEHEFADKKFNELVLYAYIEESARDCLDEKIKEFVEQHYDPNEYTDKIRVARLKKDLSKKSQIAFDAAEEQYELSKTANWGWKDAGMISLAYYRIVELEINERLLNPIISENKELIIDGNSSKIKELYDKSIENLKNEKTKSGESYKSLWSQNIKNITDQINQNENIKEPENTKDIHSLDLGNLHYLFDALDNKDKFPEEKDELSGYLKDKIKGFLKKPQELDKLIKHLNTTLLLDENRKKFRNPPAHTTYLPYEMACECREYVIENLTKFVSMLKEPDDYPNQTNNI